MSKLSDFLHPVQDVQTRDVVISERFVGEDGNPAPFTIRPVSEEENQAIRRACTMKRRDRSGTVVSEFNGNLYAIKMVIAGTVMPDFSAKELCDAYKTNDPAEVPGRMLLAGEFGRLSDAIAELSGFLDNVEERAKN